MWRALPRGPLYLRLCSFGGRTDSMVGRLGSMYWGLAGVSIATMLLIRDLASCGAGATCIFRGSSGRS